jgi:integrase/recombinase XerD
MAQAQSVTPLRQRMLDDMRLRNMAAGTRQIYVRSVADFSAFHGRSPDELTLRKRVWSTAIHRIVADYLP